MVPSGVDSDGTIVIYVEIHVRKVTVGGQRSHSHRFSSSGSGSAPDDATELPATADLQHRPLNVD